MRCKTLFFDPLAVQLEHPVCMCQKKPDSVGIRLTSEHSMLCKRKTFVEAKELVI